MHTEDPTIVGYVRHVGTGPVGPVLAGPLISILSIK